MTMPPADTFEHAGLTVRLRYEEYIDDNDNPRTNQDGNIGVMFCDYQGYNLGDDDALDPREHTIECDSCGGDGEVYAARSEDVAVGDLLITCPKCGGAGEVELSIVEYLKREHGARVILPLFVYEHGGITMSCGGRLDMGEDDFNRRGRFMGDGAGWDTSSVGVIFDTAETRKECGQEEASDEDIERQLREEVKYYDLYLTGQVYGYEVIGPDGEVMDSCWGFLEPNIWSEDSGVRYEGRQAAEACAEEIERERLEAFRWACADLITI